MRKIKNYGYIVNRQFKVNRKRNISTISGIILSIILFTIVGYLQTYYQDVNILNAINRKGNYEAILLDLSAEDMNRLENNILVDKVGLYTQLYNSTIDIGDKEKNVKVYSVDSVGLKELFYPIMNLTSGRLPQKDKEILIDSVGKNSLHKNVGETLKLGTEEYKIVGTYDKINSIEPYTIEIITYFNKEKNLKNVNAAFNVISEKNKEKIIRKIAGDMGIKDEGYGEKKLLLNQFIFYYYNNEDSTMNTSFNEDKLVEIMLYGSILVLTVFMTYGSINISIKERIEQFSILRCMGATPSKIRSLLIRESFFLAVLSIIPGVILGQLICFFISSVILQNIFPVIIPYKIYPSVIGVVVALSLINIVISTIIPVIKIGKISPIEGVKNGGGIKSTVKKRNSKLLNKIFGYNGLLAYKNIRGNNRNFLITTITSIIILTTFIVFSGYSNNCIREYNDEKKETKYVTVDVNVRHESDFNGPLKELDKYKKEVKDLGVTKEVFGRCEYFFSGVFENVNFNKWIKFKNYHDSIGQKNVNIDGQISAYSGIINLMIMDDNYLEEILSSVENKNLTLEDFKENGVLISDRMTFKNFINVEREPLFNLKENDRFTLKIDNESHDENNKSIDEKSQTILNNGKDINLKYLGSVNMKEVISGYGLGDITTLIVSRDFYNNNKDLFMKNNDEMFWYNQRINLELELKPNLNRETALKSIENYTNQIEGNYIDNKLDSWQLESGILVISSMVYLITFLTMIVGGLNLINNKNINIKLRGKEMGTLLALGISKKRLRKILMLEGIIQYFISTVVSLILSYTILSVLYKIMIYSEQLSTGKMPVLATIFGCGVLFVINVLGSYLPIRKLKYTNTTELIRNQE